jgi:hypothetical protein
VALKGKFVDPTTGLAIRVTAKGKAPELTEKDIEDFCSPDALEAVSNEIVEDWRKDAPAQFKSILDTP